MLNSSHKKPHDSGNGALRKSTLNVNRIVSVGHTAEVTHRRNIAEVSFVSHPGFLLARSNSLLLFLSVSYCNTEKIICDSNEN